MIIMKQQLRAVALLSGGLDSTLAVKLILDQSIDVEALNFVTPFCQCNRKGMGCEARRVADELGIACKTIAVTDEIFQVISNPKHGFGSGMNPCLDCRILMFSKARERMEQTGAAFVFTGEVLGQRPMSQHRRAMEIIEHESGLEGRLLRPLSARLLRPTVPETQGLVDRDRLLGMNGRSRKPQISLAADLSIRDYPCPAGGCLLTDPAFARCMRDLVDYSPAFGLEQVNLLKVGRHFRLSPTVKAVVGRNEGENQRLLAFARSDDLLLEVQGTGSPTTLLRGQASEWEIRFVAAITAHYSDADSDKITVACGTSPNRNEREIAVVPAPECEIEQYRI